MAEGEFLGGTVDVPGAGKIKKKYIYIPAGIAVAYVAYRWYVASQEAPADDGADGMYTSDDLSEYGLSTSGGSTDVTGNNGSQVTDGTNPNAIDDNAEWSQRATELLTNMGYDPMAVGNALGEFLARRSLDKTEAAIARAALAQVGQPPIGGPYSVQEEAVVGSGTLPAPTNLRAWGTHSDTQIGMQWDKVDGAAYYRIYQTGNTEPVGTSMDTMWQGRNLVPNRSYTYYVRAVNSAGKIGGNSSNYTVKTKAVALAKPGGLKSSSVTKSSFRVSCTAVKGAQFYRWYVNGKAEGASDAPYRDFTGRKANTSYRVQVAADASGQTPGPMSGALTVKTKK
jgi:hypothetical protein